MPGLMAQTFSQLSHRKVKFLLYSTVGTLRHVLRVWDVCGGTHEDLVGSTSIHGELLAARELHSPVLSIYSSHQNIPAREKKRSASHQEPLLTFSELNNY